MCQKLFKLGVRPTPVDTIKVVAGAPLKGIAFCITGEFTEDRDSITKKLVALGASSKSGVSKNTNLLIVGEAAGKSKLSKAVELNIKQVGKDWLAKTLADNGMELAGSTLDIEEA
jgi:DNA ligase (NAD+)